MKAAGRVAWLCPPPFDVLFVGPAVRAVSENAAAAAAVPRLRSIAPSSSSSLSPSAVRWRVGFTYLLRRGSVRWRMMRRARDRNVMSLSRRGSAVCLCVCVSLSLCVCLSLCLFWRTYIGLHVRAIADDNAARLWTNSVPTDHESSTLEWNPDAASMKARHGFRALDWRSSARFHS